LLHKPTVTNCGTWSYSVVPNKTANVSHQDSREAMNGSIILCH